MTRYRGTITTRRFGATAGQEPACKHRHELPSAAAKCAAVAIRRIAHREGSTLAELGYRIDALR